MAILPIASATGAPVATSMASMAAARSAQAVQSSFMHARPGLQNLAGTPTLMAAPMMVALFSRVGQLVKSGRWGNPMIELPEPPTLEEDPMLMRYDCDVPQAGSMMWKQAILQSGRLHTAVEELQTIPTWLGRAERKLSQIHESDVVIVTRSYDLKRFPKVQREGDVYDDLPPDEVWNYSAYFFLTRQENGYGRMYLTDSFRFHPFRNERLLYSGSVSVFRPRRTVALDYAVINDAGPMSGFTSPRVRANVVQFMNSLVNHERNWVAFKVDGAAYDLLAQELLKNLDRAIAKEKWLDIEHALQFYSARDSEQTGAFQNALMKKPLGTLPLRTYAAIVRAVGFEAPAIKAFDYLISQTNREARRTVDELIAYMKIEAQNPKPEVQEHILNYVEAGAAADGIFSPFPL